MQRHTVIFENRSEFLSHRWCTLRVLRGALSFIPLQRCYSALWGEELLYASLCITIGWMCWLLIMLSTKQLWNLNFLKKCKLISYFGHIMRKQELLEKKIMLRKLKGSRKRRRPKMRWIDSVKEVTTLSLQTLGNYVKDRTFWRTLIHTVIVTEKQHVGT